MSMPTWCPRTLDEHKLHPRCRQTCRFLLADLWAAAKLLWPVPLASDTTCQTSCMLCLHLPVGPTGSPNFVGRFMCSLSRISGMKRWPKADMNSIVSLSFRLGWVLSWTWMTLSPNSARCLLSLHCYWVWWRVYPWWSLTAASDTSPEIPSPWR